MDLIQRGKKLRNEKRYKEALPIYKEIWEKRTNNKVDRWIGWEYGETLKKCGCIDEAIKVCKEVHIENKEFKYNNDLLSWCLYEKYLKNTDIKEFGKDIQRIIKIADYITNIVKQSEYTPYEMIVWKIISFYKHGNVFNADKVNYWLDKLDVLLLSEEPFQYTDDNKFIREGASRKEEWFALKCKALMKMKKYQECLEVCDVALSSIKKYHYNNDIWIKSRKAYCYGQFGDKVVAIRILEELLTVREHWSIYEMIFDLKLLLNERKEALGYAYSAALTKDSPSLKINLYIKMGAVLEELNLNEEALWHYRFSKMIRLESKWNVPIEIEQSITRIEKRVCSPNDECLYNKLKQFWVNEKLLLSPRFSGIILSLLPHGKAGFIKCENNSYYFTASSIMNKYNKIFPNISVTFSLIDSYDKKKNVHTKQAVDILVNC